jgi:hypothetical protein
MIAPRSREPNGRYRRTRPEDAAAHVAGQPHRRGERSTVAATPWQRAIKAGRIRDPGGYTAGELEQAGLRFSECRRNYLKAIAAPRGWETRRYGPGGDLPPRLRRKWLREWNEVLAVVGWAYVPILSAVEAHPEGEEREWSREFMKTVSDALRRLCGHFGI